jgi:hypothetical protein
VLEYLDGEVGTAEPHYTARELGEIGRLLRDFHQASAEFVPPADARWGTVIAPDRVELIGHHDPAPWNLVRCPAGWALIDWDLAGPGSRLWAAAGREPWARIWAEDGAHWRAVARHLAVHRPAWRDALLR